MFSGEDTEKLYVLISTLAVQQIGNCMQLAAFKICDCNLFLLLLSWVSKFKCWLMVKIYYATVYDVAEFWERNYWRQIARQQKTCVISTETSQILCWVLFGCHRAKLFRTFQFWRARLDDNFSNCYLTTLFGKKKLTILDENE